MSNFKRFLLHFLLPVMGLTTVLALLLGHAFERYIVLGTEQADAGKLHRFLNSNDPQEIPIFGSSRALGSYVPLEINSHCFNYGYVDTANSLMFALLKCELQKQRTTPIIMNLDYKGFKYSPGNLNKFIPNLHNPVIRDYFGANNKRYFSIPAIKYFSLYDDLLAGYFSDKFQLTKFVQNGAAIEKNSSGISRERFLKRVERVPVRKKYAYNKQKFAEILKLLASTDRTIVFVIAPVFQADKFLSPECQRQFDEMCRQLQELPNVKLYNFRDMSDDDKDFFNISHVSLQGAMKFSRLLRQRLQEDHIL